MISWFWEEKRMFRGCLIRVRHPKRSSVEDALAASAFYLRQRWQNRPYTCYIHPVKLSRAILGMSQGIKQNDFTVAIRHAAENCHMLVYPIRDRLSLFSSFRRGRRGNYPNHETSRYCCKCACRRVSPRECTDHPDLR